MYLVDTNIFLEILLMQNKKDECEQFLNENIENLNITDVSLHSIGVILFKYNKEKYFEKFINDIFPHIHLTTLPVDLYKDIDYAKEKQKLDFDDAYQYSTAKYYKLKIVTMDNDYKKINDIKVLFL